MKEMTMFATKSEKNDNRDSIHRAFPLPGTMLYDLIFKPEFKKTAHPRIKFFNRLVVPLYKLGVLPVLGIGKQIILLTTKGEKSKKMRDFPIGYQYIDDTVYVFSGWGKEANWYANLKAYPEDVYVQSGFRRFQVRPETVEDPQELKRLMERFVTQRPEGARTLIGWDPKRDSLETADFSPMIEKVLVVRFPPR